MRSEVCALTGGPIFLPHVFTILSTSSGNGRCNAFASSHWSAHPHVALLVSRQDHRHRLGMDRLDDCVGRCGQEAIETRCGPGIGLDIVPRSARRRQCGRDVCLCPNSHTYDQKSIRLSPFEQTGQIHSVPTPLLEAVIGWGGEMERSLR